MEGKVQKKEKQPLGKRIAAWGKRLLKNIKRDKALLLIILPVVIHYLVFVYYPMYGNIIAFKKYSPVKGIMGSEWVGVRYFIQFFESPYFTRVLRNTLLISIYSILWGFPIPILFALMTNDLKHGVYKRVVQAVSYVPYFISTVIICGMLVNFLSPSSGIINSIIEALGGEKINFLMEPKWFRTIFVASGVWQGFGWSAIVYLAALTGVSQELYEAARVDGASKIQQVLHVSIPSILPTIVVTFIMQIGTLMSVGYEKVILLYNPVTLEVGDVISSYTYRTGLVEGNYSFASAVGLFNSVINLALVIFANKLSKKVSEVSLW
ncbi:MAG: ABC transporter permease subunit [Roseburia sp.]|nr:ABC transporter permease subunit [Roseburia sp.]MCM1098247.1 ABC transporter permease subunit [Ruminococcus flavefaciens]